MTGSVGTGAKTADDQICDHVYSWMNYFTVWDWESGKLEQYHEKGTDCVFCPKCGIKL